MEDESVVAVSTETTTSASDFKIAFQYLLGWEVLLSVLTAKCYLYPVRFKFCFQIWSCRKQRNFSEVSSEKKRSEIVVVESGTLVYRQRVLTRNFSS